MLRPSTLAFGLTLLAAGGCDSPPSESPAAPATQADSAGEPTQDDGAATPDDVDTSGSGSSGAPATATSEGSSGVGDESSQPETSSGDDPGVEPEVPAPGTWIAVEPGTFLMGARPTDACPMSSHNDIAHEVTLTRAFEISATEVTFADYRAATGQEHPSAHGCDDCPIALVRWHDAAAVCNDYSAFAGLPACYECSGEGDARTCTPIGSAYECNGYRLPSEAEWEYAARAGETEIVHGGQIEVCGYADPLLDTLGWYLYDSDGATHPVAGKLPNMWGLYDTIGNVWEWTHDGYVQDLSTVPPIDPLVDSPDGFRVMRGGSYNCLPGEVRLAHRSGLPDVISGLNVGLRCARTL